MGKIERRFNDRRRIIEDTTPGEGKIELPDFNQIQHKKRATAEIDEATIRQADMAPRDEKANTLPETEKNQRERRIRENF